ncbi:MAG TPA: CsgG/HfaB family protein [Flavobacteriales bacterium]|nr:CsgG/HfaB family protein [Flavobacteriales bacterium]HRO38312.1 CsgG/HfaB family protein [Flavobacteriales bacterium]HRP80441.1 CsgG/HfaB family protein [Flavobacteriales bacterium]
MKTYAAIIAAMLLGASGCTGSKPLSKKAAKLDAGGMYAEAAEMYFQSAQRNANNVDAKIGLKKTGQMLLNDKLSTFFKAFATGDSKEAAVNAFLDAQSYRQRVGRAGVVLEIPDSYAKDFDQVKGEYLVDLYSQGNDLMAKDDYTGAEALFAKIGKLEPGYKDSKTLQDIAFLEPLYRSGKTALAAGQYRNAYNDLARVTGRNAQYKDAAALKQECVEKGRYPIAVLPFSTAGGVPAAQAASLQAHVTAALTNMNDPFISVVDRDNIQKILDEQKLGMSGMVDETSAVSAGKLMGAQAVVMGTVIAFSETPGRVRQSTKEGYESYQVKELNAETNAYAYVTRYKPVKYTELYKENKANLSFSFKLVSLETGQVLMSKVVEREANDHAWYASYDGNTQALYPVLNGQVDTRNSARRELGALLAAPRTVKSTAELVNELLRTTSMQVAGGVEQTLAGKP